MSHARSLVVGACAVMATVGMLPAPASAATDGSLQDLVLTGECPGQVGDLKSVIATGQSASLWGPLHLMTGDFVDTKKSLFPYEIFVTGEGLKTRHLTGGETYVRPGKAPKNPVTCILNGATKEDGPFQVTITGAVRGAHKANCPKKPPAKPVAKLA